MAIICSTLRRALSATSRGIEISSFPSINDRSNFSGVIIFMYLHTAARFTGSKMTFEFAWRNWCNMPVSVATSTFFAVVCSAAVIMPDVLKIFVRSRGTTPVSARYIADVAHPHSG